MDLFGLRPVYKEEWWTESERFLGVGGTIVALFQDKSHDSAPLNRNKPGCHFAFRVDAISFDEYKQELANRDIDYRFEDYGSTLAMYFSDPDSYQIEITTYR